MSSRIPVPQFSALGSVYAGEEAAYLDMGLRSLGEQTLRADEVVLVHDGQLTDGLYSCLKKWRKILPLKEVGLDVAGGLARALNRGLKECSHGWVARFDTDDINRPRRFETQMEYLAKNPKTDVLSSAIEEFRQTPGDLGRVRETVHSHVEIFYYAKTRSPMNHPSVVFKKSAVLAVGGYQNDVPHMEDYDLWLRMIERGYIFANLPECLVDYRVGDGMLGRRRGIRYAKSEYSIHKTKKRLGFNPSLSVFILRFCARLLPLRLLKPVYILLRQPRSVQQ